MKALRDLIVFLGFAKPYPPTALQQAVADLEDARLEWLQQNKLCEYHQGMVNVLDTRITRLKQDIEQLSKGDHNASAP